MKKRAAKALWLDRGLVIGPYLALVTSQAEFEQALDRLQLVNNLGDWLGAANARTWTFDQPCKVMDLACVVCMPIRLDKTGIQQAALLMHESAHVWQAWCDKAGERHPSSEFEAYALQNIAQTLMEAYAEALERARAAA